MTVLHLDSALDDNLRRKRLYEGDVFVFSPSATSLGFCEFTRTMIQEAFDGLDPRTAQFELPTDRYTTALAALKPKFVHHPESRRYVHKILTDLGCDLDRTYVDVPRLKSIPHGAEHLSGLTYAIHAHRDTWYSAPFCQMNWWFPVYDLELGSGLAFHPEHWDRPVANTSETFNHYRWNKYGRKAAATSPERYIHDQPHAEEAIDVARQIVPMARAGAVILFSAAHLHSAVPNTSGRTRFSIDFRTVHLDDVSARAGAPNIDSACTGTSLRDFLRGSDLAPMADEIVAAYDPEPIEDGELVFQAGARRE